MIIRTLVSLFFIIFSTQIYAQEYPTKPIKLILPTNGGNADTVGRLLAEYLKEELKTPIICVNMGGASGSIGVSFLKNSEPDGYTLGFGTALHFISASVYRKTPLYDPIKDFEPISEVFRSDFAIAVRSNSDIKSLDDLTKNKSLSYGTPGVGSASHILGIILSKHYKVDMIPVHYRGETLTIPDTINGNLDWVGLSQVEEFVKGGQLRVLATSGKTRWFKDIPTLIESGISFDYSSFGGLFAPKNTDNEIIKKLNSSVMKVMKNEEFRNRVIQLGFIPTGSTVSELKLTVEEMTKLIQDIKTKYNIVSE